MGNYGIKVSRAGYDVFNCSDRQLLFSSAFPSLNVIYSGTRTGIVNGQSYDLKVHNLGYIPAFFAITRQDGASAPERVFMDMPEIRMSSSKLWWDDSKGGASGTATVSWWIFARTISESFTAPKIQTTDDTQGSYGKNYGLKVSKTGKSVYSSDQADLAMSSGVSVANSPIRHQIVHKTGTSSVNHTATKSIAHGLGYRPMFIVYRKESSQYYIDAVTYSVNPGPPISVDIEFRAYCDTNNIYVENHTGFTIDFAYLILKDPLG